MLALSLLCARLWLAADAPSAALHAFEQRSIVRMGGHSGRTLVLSGSTSLRYRAPPTWRSARVTLQLYAGQPTAPSRGVSRLGGALHIDVPLLRRNAEPEQQALRLTLLVRRAWLGDARLFAPTFVRLALGGEMVRETGSLRGTVAALSSSGVARDRPSVRWRFAAARPHATLVVSVAGRHVLSGRARAPLTYGRIASTRRYARALRLTAAVYTPLTMLQPTFTVHSRIDLARWHTQLGARISSDTAHRIPRLRLDARTDTQLVLLHAWMLVVPTCTWSGELAVQRRILGTTLRTVAALEQRQERQPHLRWQWRIELST